MYNDYTHAEKMKINIYTDKLVLIGETYLKVTIEQYEEDEVVKTKMKSFYNPILSSSFLDNMLSEKNVTLNEESLILYFIDNMFNSPQKISAKLVPYYERRKVLMTSYKVLELSEDDLKLVNKEKSNSLSFMDH